MNDGNLLLLAVLRTKAREQSATDALCDFVLEHLPPRTDALVPLRSLVLNAELKVRSAKLHSWWTPVWSMRDGSRLMLRTEVIHYRGLHHPHGDRYASFCEDPDHLTFALQFRELLKVFRS